MCFIDKTFCVFFTRYDHKWINVLFRRSCVIVFCFLSQFSVFYCWAQTNPSIPTDTPQNPQLRVDVVAPKTNIPTQPRKNLGNPWGSFLPGTWVLRRTNAQLISPHSTTNNVTDTLLTLEAIEENGIRLRQETAIGIANSAFTPEPKHVLLDSHLQPFSEGIVTEQLPPQTVIVTRRQIVCQVSRYTQVLGNQKKVTTLWYSDTVMPYLLRSEEIRTNRPHATDPSETVISHTIMTVTDTSGVRLFKNLLSEYKTQTIKKNATGTVVSQATHSTNIPGGLLREVTVETDTTNKVVGRSVTTVIDYFVACPGVSVRQRRLDSEASQEIQSNWDNIPNQAPDKLSK